MTTLGLSPDDLNKCVQCGLCLPHCPTFRATGDESRSPRGRIALMRAVESGVAPVTNEVVESFSTCIQCRGCEPACPSSVPYGQLMEKTRESLVDSGKATPRWQKIALWGLTKPRLLRISTTGIGLVQRVVPRAVPARLGLPKRLPLRQKPLTGTGDDVWLFTGCVMDAWQRDVHGQTKAVLEAAGFGVRITGDAAPCCGALHSHAGLGSQAQKLAETMMASLGGDAPIVVDSAGCGAAMKDYDHLVGTDESKRFSARVFDIHEFLALNADQSPVPIGKPVQARVAIHDPCHLRHVQRVHAHTRTVLGPAVAELVELNDQGLCCGAGGAFLVLEPELAAQVRERKLAAIKAADVDIVASANPGCSLYLAAAGVKVVHPVELIANALAKGVVD